MAMRAKPFTEIPVDHTDGREVKIVDSAGNTHIAQLLPKETTGKLLPAGVFAIDAGPGFAFGYQKDEEGFCRVIPLQPVAIS